MCDNAVGLGREGGRVRKSYYQVSYINIITYGLLGVGTVEAHTKQKLGQLK